jgi:hypothetical protein
MNRAASGVVRFLVGLLIFAAIVTVLVTIVRWHDRIDEELILAVARGDSKGAIRLFRLGGHAELRRTEEHPMTMMEMAARNDDVAMLELLVRHGGRVNPKGPGYSPLAAAAAEGSVNALKWLIGHGADVQAGRPRALFAAFERCELESIRILLSTAPLLSTSERKSFAEEAKALGCRGAIGSLE